jgi:hypothetical protein
METVGEETTTLPEGYSVSVCKLRMVTKRGGHTFTELRAWRENKVVAMRVDDVGGHVLRQYLELWVREINRRRAALTAMPDATVYQTRKPENIAEFVIYMAINGMFIFGALDNGE